MKLLLSIIKKKGLKISEAANTRRTDNSLTKRKTTKRQTMVGKTLHRKLKISSFLVPYLKTNRLIPLVIISCPLFGLNWFNSKTRKLYDCLVLSVIRNEIKSLKRFVMSRSSNSIDFLLPEFTT
jgi:hypothetical protein